METILAFLVVIGVVVVVHEFGHFIAARSVGIRVERFSVGFPPRMIGKKFGDTDYCLSWIPLGGYVKMAGMIDESMDNPDNITGAPDEFMSKNYFQKVWVISAGVILNFVLAWAIYSGLTLKEGVPIPSEEAIPTAVVDGKPAAEAGLQAGDKLVRIGNTPIESWSQVVETIHGNPGVALEIEWIRDGETQVATVTPDAEKSPDTGETIGLIGIAGPGIDGYEKVGFLTAIKSGTDQTLFILGQAVKSIKMLFTGAATVKDLGGPVMIAKWSGEVAEQGSVALARFIAFISINIGFLNILPIPVLDGGHLVLITAEAIAGRPIPTKVKIGIQQVGMVGLLVLMATILWFDMGRVGLFSKVAGLFG